MIIRESTRLPRQFRDGVRATQDLLQAEVDQEEQLFGDEQLTAEEKQQHELSKKILAMVGVRRPPSRETTPRAPRERELYAAAMAWGSRRRHRVAAMA